MQTMKQNYMINLPCKNKIKIATYNYYCMLEFFIYFYMVGILSLIEKIRLSTNDIEHNNVKY